MIVLDDYKFNVDNNVFQLRSRDYQDTGIKITKEEPLLKLESIHILDHDEKFQFSNYRKKDGNYLIIHLLLYNKTILFVYEGIYDVDNNLIKQFLEKTINRPKRIKVIPFTNYSSFFFKLNKPILLGKKVKIIFNKHDNYFEIKFELRYSFIQKILKRLIKKKVTIYLGLTIETYKEDNIDEELLCVFGLNKLDYIS